MSPRDEEKGPPKGSPDSTRELTGEDAQTTEAMEGSAGSGSSPFGEDQTGLGTSTIEDEREYRLEDEPGRARDIEPDSVEPTPLEGRPERPRTERSPGTVERPRAAGQLVSAVMRRWMPTLHDTEEVDLLELLSRSRFTRFWPVIDEERRLLGIINRGDLLMLVMAGASGMRRASQIMTRNPHQILADAPLWRAAQAMQRQKARSLLVVDSAGHLQGMVTDGDLLSALSREMAHAEPLEALTVDALMTRDPVLVEAEATVDEAASKMLQFGMRHLPVVDSEGRVVGIVSERDLRGRLGGEEREWVHAAREALDEAVGNLMTPDPVVLRTGTSLPRAIEIFMTERVGAIPVVDEEERPLGILSYVDLLRWLRDRVTAQPQKAEAGQEPLHPS